MKLKLNEQQITWLKSNIEKDALIVYDEFVEKTHKEIYNSPETNKEFVSFAEEMTNSIFTENENRIKNQIELAKGLMNSNLNWNDLNFNSNQIKKINEYLKSDRDLSDSLYSITLNSMSGLITKMVISSFLSHGMTMEEFKKLPNEVILNIERRISQKIIEGPVGKQLEQYKDSFKKSEEIINIIAKQNNKVR